MEYSLFGRDIEDHVLPVCRELGIATVCYSVLAGGLLGGDFNRSRQDASMRDGMPRFQSNNLDTNLALVENLKRIATAKGVSVATLSIAWVLAQGVDLVPLVGVRKPEKLVDALAAVRLSFSDQELAEIAAAVPRAAVAGKQYAGFIQNMIEQERAQR